MDLTKARKLANDLMEEFGLDNWSFRFDRGKNRFGSCRPSRHQITLSKHLTKLNERVEVEDTIRHEIAHALDFEDRGRSDHSHHWKKWAVKVGARPEACYTSGQVNNKYKYFDYCPRCGNKRGFHRRRNKKRLASCGKCRRGSFDLNYLVIHNVPAKTMKKIEAGDIRWQDTPQAKEVYEKLQLFYMEFEAEGTDFYEAYNQPSDAPVKIAARTKKKSKSKPKKKRGVIATIAKIIEDSGEKGVTKEEILDTLVQDFPNREADSMKNTINTQVPYRINKERFKLEKIDERYRKKQ